MKTILESDSFKGGVLIKKHLKGFKSNIYKEEEFQVDNCFEQGIVKEIILNGVKVVIRDIAVIPHKVKVTHDFPFFKLQFEMEGSSDYKPLNNLSKGVSIPGGYYNLFYLPEVKGVLNYNTSFRKTLEIIFTENYFKKIIGENYKKLFKTFGEAVTKNIPFLMWENSKPISLKLKNHIHDIVNCNYEDDLKKVYLETKINELLILLLSKTNDDNYNGTNTSLNKKNIFNFLKIEEYIKENLHKNITIASLASFAGMNMTKLKQEFKETFSTSIFKYITKLRMEKAKLLIEENGYTISEAAYSVGYKHAHHFTVAFKKVYGFLPSELKKVKVI